LPKTEGASVTWRWVVWCLDVAQRQVGQRCKGRRCPHCCHYMDKCKEDAIKTGCFNNHYLNYKNQ
jgi:hypothetical protein